MKGLVSAHPFILPEENEQSLRYRSEQTSSKNLLLPLFGLRFWCFTLEEQGARACIIPPSEQPEQLYGAAILDKMLSEQFPILLPDGGSKVDQKTLLEAPLPLST